MPSLPQYLLELTLCLGAWALLYRGLHGALPVAGRRAYLLLAPVLSLALPLLYFGPATPVSELTTADPEFFDHFHRGTYDPDALPPFVLHLGDLVLYVYFIGLVFAAFRLLDRWWRIYRQLQRRSARRNAHYAVVDSPVAAVPYSLLPHIYWNQHRLTRHWRYLWTHERTDLRVRHALDALWLDALVMVLWFHPLSYWFRRQVRSLHERRATHYGRAKLARLRGYLHSLTPGHVFAPAGAPPPPAPRPVPAWRRAGALLAVVACGGLLAALFALDLTAGFSVGKQLRGADRQLTALGSIQLYTYVPPRPPDNYQFYWGRKLSVILPPLAADERTPLPTGPSAELTLTDLKRALAEEPLLSLQHGPLFNGVRFELALERNYETLLECAVRADAGDPDAYPNNSCLQGLLDLVRPNDLLVLRALQHDFRKITTHPPNFSIRIRGALGFGDGNPNVPSPYRLRWGARSVPCYRTPFSYLLCETQHLAPAALDSLGPLELLVDGAEATYPLDQVVFHARRQDTLLGYAHRTYFTHDTLLAEQLRPADALELFGRIEHFDASRKEKYQQFRARFSVGDEPPPAHRFELDTPVAYRPGLDRLFYFSRARVAPLATTRLRFYHPDGSPRPLRRLSVENMTSLQRVRLPDAAAPYPPEWASLMGAVAADDLLHFTGTFADGGPLDLWWQLR